MFPYRSQKVLSEYLVGLVVVNIPCHIQCTPVADSDDAATQLFAHSVIASLDWIPADDTPLNHLHAKFEEACKKASVHDFIMSLPHGYDTPVGELGDTLSGGERQRLGLARAFLHNAPFMLLDEPTSNLDSLNEAVILKSLREERGDKTVILVSHRQSTMRIADKVYSVEHGRMS